MEKKTHTDREAFRERLIDLRLKDKEHDSQKKFADFLGVSKNTYCKWEQGVKYPSKKNLKNILEKTGADLDYFSKEIKEKNRDLKFICEYTGLSEKAVGVLHFLSEGSQISHTNNLDILNYILEEQFNTEAPADRQRKLEEDMEKVKPGLSKSYHGAKSPLLVNVHNILYQIRECLILKNPGAWEGNITKQLPNGETITSTDHALHFSLFDLSKKITDLNEKDDFLRWMEEKKDRL